MPAPAPAPADEAAQAVKPAPLPAPAPADKAMPDEQKPRLFINGREVTLPANGGTIIIDENGRVTTPAQP